MKEATTEEKREVASRIRDKFKQLDGTYPVTCTQWTDYHRKSMEFCQLITAEFYDNPHFGVDPFTMTFNDAIQWVRDVLMPEPSPEPEPQSRPVLAA